MANYVPMGRFSVGIVTSKFLEVITIYMYIIVLV